MQEIYLYLSQHTFISDSKPHCLSCNEFQPNCRWIHCQNWKALHVAWKMGKAVWTRSLQGLMSVTGSLYSEMTVAPGAH